MQIQLSILKKKYFTELMEITSVIVQMNFFALFYLRKSK